MKSVLKAVEGASANVRYGYDTAKHVGLLFNRVAGSPFTGICTVCNNIRPEGHENTFGRERGFFQSWHEESAITARRQLADVPTLEIEGIKAADLLEWKENSENGRSRRNCPYCRFLLTVLDQYFPQWSSVTGHPGELTVMIRDNSPLIIACSRFVPDTTWLTARIDLEVYRSFGRFLPLAPFKSFASGDNALVQIGDWCWYFNTDRGQRTTVRQETTTDCQDGQHWARPRSGQQIPGRKNASTSFLTACLSAQNVIRRWTNCPVALFRHACFPLDQKAPKSDCSTPLSTTNQSNGLHLAIVGEEAIPCRLPNRLTSKGSVALARTNYQRHFVTPLRWLAI